MGKILQQDKSTVNGTRSRKRTGVRKPRQSLLKFAKNNAESKNQMQDEPPYYIHIKSNEFVHRGHKKQKLEDIPICECKYDATDPESMCGERCLNVLTSTECTPGHCPCGDNCRNQRFQRCEYVKTKLFKTDRRGWGLLADQEIKAGQFVIEYCGEVISCTEAKKRVQIYEEAGLKDAFIITLNRSELIDATKKGSLARFINHSCEPNCETRKWTVLGEIRVGIFAKQDISSGTELSYDYKFEWFGGTKVRCLCGAAPCLGFLGAKSRGFQNDAYLWEDNDDRYSVENVPLYDSDEDEPLSIYLNRAKICKKLKLAVAKSKPNDSDLQHPVAGPAAAPDLHLSDNNQNKCEASKQPLIGDKLTSIDLADAVISNVHGDSHEIQGNELVLYKNDAKIESLSEEMPSDKPGRVLKVYRKNKVSDMEKKEKGAKYFKEQNLIAYESHTQANGIILEEENELSKNSEHESLESEQLLQSNRSSYLSCQKSKTSGNKRVNAEQIGQILPLKKVCPEVLKAEQVKSIAGEKLDSLYDKIRPVIEEHGKDGQHSVPTSFAEEWIKADCDNLKATFDLHFSIIKNLPTEVLANHILMDQVNAVDKID